MVQQHYYSPLSTCQKFHDQPDTTHNYFEGRCEITDPKVWTNKEANPNPDLKKIRISVLISNNNDTLANYQWQRNHVEKAVLGAIDTTRSITAFRQEDVPKNRPETHQNKLNKTLLTEFCNDGCSSVDGIDVIINTYCQDANLSPDIYLGATCDIVVDFIDNICGAWDVPVISVGTRDDIFINGLVIHQDRSTLVRVGPTAQLQSGPG